MDLTAYRAAIKDELLCLYSAFGNCNVTNADRTVHQGIEAGLGVALFKNVFARGGQADKLWLNLAYTFNDFRFDHDAAFGTICCPVRRATSFAPRCSTSTQRFYFGPNVEWVPQGYYADSANTLSTDGYAIYGLKAGFDDGGRYSAYIEARNLANKGISLHPPSSIAPPPPHHMLNRGRAGPSMRDSRRDGIARDVSIRCGRNRPSIFQGERPCLIFQGE